MKKQCQLKQSHSFLSFKYASYFEPSCEFVTRDQSIKKGIEKFSKSRKYTKERLSHIAIVGCKTSGRDTFVRHLVKQRDCFKPITIFINAKIENITKETLVFLKDFTGDVIFESYHRVSPCVKDYIRDRINENHKFRLIFSLELEDQCFLQEIVCLTGASIIFLKSFQERKKDLPFVVNHYFSFLRPNFRCAKELLDKLSCFSWQKGVLHLKYVIFNIHLLDIQFKDLDHFKLQSIYHNVSKDLDFYEIVEKVKWYEILCFIRTYGLKEVLSLLEGKIIASSYYNCFKNANSAAKILGLAPSTFKDKKRKYMF